MNNKGFVFIETIITVVVLTTTLVFLYASYSRVVITEQKRLYYDNISYVYKTQMIKEVLDETINKTKFRSAVETKRDEMYFYIFNTESDIYFDNADITNLKREYNFYQLIYIKIEDIVDLKECLKNEYGDNKCATTIGFAKTYGAGHLEDYLLSLDVDEHISDGILVSLIYEMKNGDVKVDTNNIVTLGQGKYSECLIDQISKYYGVADESDDVKLDKIEEYRKNDKLSFNMACEHAYYMSWVYL